MGKPLQAVSLVVKERFKNEALARTLSKDQELAAKRGEEESVEAAEIQLQQLTEHPDNDDYATWQVLPKELLPGGRSQLLPDNLQGFPTKLGKHPREAAAVAKQVLTLVYTAAHTATDGDAYVPLPPETALEDPEMRRSLIWHGMAIVEPEPEDRISNLIRTADPKWMPRNQLTARQGSAYDERAAVVDVAAWVFFWARQGWMPELETEEMD